jgi:hypothetical protein
MIASLGVAIAAVVVIVVADMGGGWEWDVGDFLLRSVTNNYY